MSKTLLVLGIIASYFGFPFLSKGSIGKELFWPTENTAFYLGKDPVDYLQATGSGRIESGDYGCTRNGGTRFHEGIDLKAIRRDANGIARDPIRAIHDGLVVHLSADPSRSNYGTYVVISHQNRGLEWCSLYAHLRSVSPTLKVGETVRGGEVIGIMGNTSSTMEIPESRAHLHLEIGFRLTSYFDNWYKKQDYASANHHRSWNGINFVGIDPIAFYRYAIEHPEEHLESFFIEQPVSFEMLIHFQDLPDFILRNPAFLGEMRRFSDSSWFLVGFTWYGLPIEWVALDPTQIDNRFDITQFYIRSFKHEKPCRNWIDDEANGLNATPLLTHRINLLIQD